jgi:hypothetical protein
MIARRLYDLPEPAEGMTSLPFSTFPTMLHAAAFSTSVASHRRHRQRQPATVRCSAEPGRRAVVLHSNAALLLASLLNLGGARPSGAFCTRAKDPPPTADLGPACASPLNQGLGVQRFGTVSTLALCPRSPECISTSEEANDAGRYVPPWTYARSEESVKRGLDKPTISRSDAMAQLVAVVRATSPDGWEPNVVKQQGDEVRSYGDPHCCCLLAHLLRSTAVPLRGVHLSSPGPHRRR